MWDANSKTKIQNILYHYISISEQILVMQKIGMKNHFYGS